MLSLQTQVLVTSAAYLLCIPIVSAQGWWGNGNGNGNWNGDNCPPWVSTDDCNNNGGSSSGSGANSALNSFNAEIQQQSRIITIHAILACLVWVFLIPLGGILVRLGIRSPWIVRIHAILQSLSYLIYLAAAVLGIWLVRLLSDSSFDDSSDYSYSLWSDPHPKLGIAILVAAFFQPIFGLIHHTIYKRRVAATKAGRPTKPPGRTAIGTIHLWLGRLLIVLGVVNGGLGLRLASYTDYDGNTRTKAIAYGIGSGIMLLLYFIFIVRGEVRRSKGLKESKRQADEASRNNVPLLNMGEVQARAVAPPLYTAENMNVPPSYEDSQMSGQTGSQASAVKEAHTTARYH